MAGSAIPKPVRSLRELVDRGLAAPAAHLPITEGGTTYSMAQEVRWLDDRHFAVGRWDGSLSVFEFETAPSTGPLIAAAVNSPEIGGVRSVSPLPGGALATSNDESSLTLWSSDTGAWSGLRIRAVVGHDPALGPAATGVWAGTKLVTGHVNGYLALWSFTDTLEFERAVDVRNPHPVNPFGDHTIEDVVAVTDDIVVAGSEDGYPFLHVPSATIRSQTVFNPDAQRGINALAVSGDRLLVANCAVGPRDHNLWYFTIDRTGWRPTLVDRVNLVIDPTRPQVFDFDLAWGTHAGVECWFAATEEGALWMGTATPTALRPGGYQQLSGPIGAALNTRGDRLVMVAYDLYQFVTG